MLLDGFDLHERLEAEIESVVGGRYAGWRIGITDDPERRKQEHGNPSWFFCWHVGHEGVARSLEKEFKNRGMFGGVGGRGEGEYLYLFPSLA
jgi:hypothetical protein